MANELNMIIPLGDLPRSSDQTNQLFHSITTTAEELLKSQAALWISPSMLRHSDTSTFSSPDEDDYHECTPDMKVAIERRKVTYKKYSVNEESAKTFTMVSPIISENIILGALSVIRQNKPYTRRERELFKGLILQSGFALGANQNQLPDRSILELLELIRNISRQIINIYDIHELCQRVIRLIINTFHYSYVAIYMIDNNYEKLHLIYGSSPLTSTVTHSNELPQALSIKIGDGILGKVAQTGCEILENNRTSSYHNQYVSELVIPLIIGDKTIGVIDLLSEHVDAFTGVTSQVLRMLSDQVAIAINNARLYSDLNLRVTHLNTVADISKAISSILDFDHLLSDIVSLIHIRFSVPRVNIFTVNPGIGKIFYRVGAGQLSSTELLLPFDFSYDIDQPVNPVSLSVRNRKTISVENVLTDSQYSFSPASLEQVASELVIPLIFGGQVLGALDLQSQKQSAFTSDDISLFEALADYIAVAFRNANLYSSEQWRRQVSDSVREVAGLLTTDIELSQVLDKILRELYKTLPCDVAAIWLLDDFETESGIGQYTSGLRLAAFYPENDELNELMVIDNFTGSLSPWMLEAIDSKQPLIRMPTSPYEPLGSLLNFPLDYSAIAAPLRAGNQILGLLVLTQHESGRYGNESQMMTATFANYSAVAIKNTRLYQAAHDQAWVSTALLQVAEATQSFTSMMDLIETVARIIPGLIGLKTCVFFTWDDITEMFTPVTESGLDENQKIEYLSWQIAPGDLNAFDQILENKAPVIIEGSTIPIETKQRLPFLNFSEEMFALFPLVAQNRILGAILVSIAHTDDFISQSMGIFEQKFSLLQGIANQVAVAVDNIRLLQSQEEEAYISVALLQVAQAIVSLSSLDEIISAIVRITPILVGVKRCVVYLCDEEKKEFYISQHFGISKQDLLDIPKKYSYNTHYLLDTIYQTGHPAYRLIIDEEESPSKWSTYTSSDIIPIQTDTGVQGERTTQLDIEFIKSTRRVLIGFPLIIKNNMLGVMIVEESENPRGASTYHLRQRRLEIITGITQQTALAIQNEMLQHEAIGRERLEREMQLAREIQTTFLPEKVPDVPGWELDVCWQPARQVGGDFYDFIYLGDDQIALVMADVADKGMPAALFMTLVRTLIRAAAKDNQSPSVILKQVNDLLVPDAKQGMFVTVFLAIFSKKNGTITYANAGHNPPIIHRVADDSLHELMPTGMALGVLDSASVVEQTISIESGDRIIFYTDGITEAFSENDEMFGVERLRSTIRAGHHESAKELIHRIIDALVAFENGAHQSDDLTIAALIRLDV